MSEIKLKINRLLKWVMVLAVVAMGVTGYLIYLHYASSGDSFCNINETFDCDIVNQSEWSELFGIPVAVLGFLTYLVILLLSLGLLGGFDFRRFWVRLRPKLVIQLLFFFTFFGTAFSMYLSYIELFVLRTICILCVTQQVIIFVQLVLLMAILILIDKDSKTHDVCEYC